MAAHIQWSLVDQIHLVIGHDLPLSPGSQFVYDLVRPLYLEVSVIIRAVHCVYEQIRVFDFLQGGFERFHQAMRQLADKAHRVYQNELASLLDSYFPVLSVQRSK